MVTLGTEIVGDRLGVQIIGDRDIVVFKPDAGLSITYRKDGLAPLLVISANSTTRAQFANSRGAASISMGLRAYPLMQTPLSKRHFQSASLHWMSGYGT